MFSFHRPFYDPYYYYNSNPFSYQRPLASPDEEQFKVPIQWLDENASRGRWPRSTLRNADFLGTSQNKLQRRTLADEEEDEEDEVEAQIHPFRSFSVTPTVPSVAPTLKAPSSARQVSGGVQPGLSHALPGREGTGVVQRQLPHRNQREDEDDDDEDEGEDSETEQHEKDTTEPIHTATPQESSMAVNLPTLPVHNPEPIPTTAPAPVPVRNPEPTPSPAPLPEDTPERQEPVTSVTPPPVPAPSSVPATDEHTPTSAPHSTSAPVAATRTFSRSKSLTSHSQNNPNNNIVHESHQNPEINQKLQKIDSIFQAVKDIATKYKQTLLVITNLDLLSLSRVPPSKAAAMHKKVQLEVAKYEEELMKAMLRLDELETGGDPDLRAKRKNVVEIIQRMLQPADVIKKDILPKLLKMSQGVEN